MKMLVFNCEQAMLENKIKGAAFIIKGMKNILSSEVFLLQAVINENLCTILIQIYQKRKKAVL